MPSKILKRGGIGLAVGIFVAGMIGAHLESKTPFGIARKANAIAAYEKYIQENPQDSRVPEAEKQIRLMKYSFRPKFFVICPGKDLLREISFFEYSITTDQAKAETLAYVDAPEFDNSGSCKVIVRLVDKKTNRERTIVATSSQPEWVRQAVGSGRITGSGGGSHSIDGHVGAEAHNGQGWLLTDVLEYAQKLESDKP